MAATITLAHEARRLGQELVDLYHPHLRDATVLYLFTDKPRTSKGRLVLGSAKKTSVMEQFLSQIDGDREAADFILLFDGEAWLRLSAAQRLALVDHELMHCGVEYDPDTEEPKWTIRGHDVEEFAEIIERHGLWEPSVQRMAVAMEQLRLPIEVPA